VVPFPTFYRSLGGYFSFGCSQNMILTGKIVKLYKSHVFLGAVGIAMMQIKVGFT